jgi:hypothetical protein
MTSKSVLPRKKLTHQSHFRVSHLKTASKAFKTASKAFEKELARTNKLLTDGKWVSVFVAETNFADDTITNWKSTKQDHILKFKELPNGLLRAVSTEFEDGVKEREVYIGSIIPGAKEFTLSRIDGEEYIQGILDCKTGSLTMQEFKPVEQEYEIYNFVNTNMI